jgi:DNA-binding MarR family transcriptional regulator
MIRLDDVSANSPNAQRTSEVPGGGAHHVGHLVRLAQQIHTRLWASDVSGEVTSPQYLLLSVLANSPDIDQRTATEQADLDRSTGAELIARLAAKGLIERRRDPLDGRRFLLHLSPPGESLVDSLRPAIWLLNEKMVELVPVEYREGFLAGMESFVKAGERVTLPS